jgi:hypothetical protein
MLERLELATDKLATKRPERIEDCLSNQDGTFTKQETKLSNVKMAATVTDSAVAAPQKQKVDMDASIVIKKEGDSSAKPEQPKLEEMEDVKSALPKPKGKSVLTTPDLRTSKKMMALSSIKELLVESALLLERIQPADDELTMKRPEIIEVCPSNKDRTCVIKQEKMATTVTDFAVAAPQKQEVTSNWTDTNSTCPAVEKVQLPSPLASTPISTEQLMLQTSMNREVLKKRMKYNLDLIHGHVGFMIQGGDKTRENATLTSLMLKLCEKQASLSEQLEREYQSNNYEALEKARENTKV